MLIHRQQPLHMGFLVFSACAKEKQELFCCDGMCTDEVIAKCLFLFHVPTGCDSCFYGHGKSILNATMINNAEASKLLATCGVNFPLKADILNDPFFKIIRFVCGDMRS